MQRIWPHRHNVGRVMGKDDHRLMVVLVSQSIELCKPLSAKISLVAARIQCIKQDQVNREQVDRKGDELTVCRQITRR